MSKRRRGGKTRIKAPSLAPVHIATREVDDPDFSPDHEIGYAGNRKTTTVAVNIKESAVETLFTRRFLGISQKRAADRFREVWELAGGKTASLDYTLDRVDGGLGDPVMTRIRAAQELQRCRNLLGRRGYETVVKVCGEGRSLQELTPHKRERLTVADNLRADLDDLGTMWGMQTKRNR